MNAIELSLNGANANLILLRQLFECLLAKYVVMIKDLIINTFDNYKLTPATCA